MELWRLSASELARRIAAGEVSAREAVDSNLERIEAVNGHLNAAVVVLADEARAAADAADRAGSGGPLHGVPFTVKENIDVAGTATTSGIPALAEAVSPSTRRWWSACAPRARSRSPARTCPDLGLRIHTDSSLRGLTRNPWHPGVTAGGSSGGEASALASGMSPIGLGNDVGGSLRNPAHCCGIASIKPSRRPRPARHGDPAGGLGPGDAGDVRRGRDGPRGGRRPARAGHRRGRRPARPAVRPRALEQPAARQARRRDGRPARRRHPPRGRRGRAPRGGRAGRRRLRRGGGDAARLRGRAGRSGAAGCSPTSAPRRSCCAP